MSSSEGNQEAAPMRCPRCDSPDTKFCYYNNYSTTQPRHFCKNCKRYWTAGGSLRNVPVGGGLRKNKKAKLQTSESLQSMSSSKSKSKSKIKTGGLDDDLHPTSSSSADEPLKPGSALRSVKPSTSPALAFGQNPARSEALIGGGGGGLGLGLGFPYEESQGATHTSAMLNKYNPSLDDTTSYYTPHYPSPGGFPLPHNNGGIQTTSTLYSAPYEPTLSSHPSQSADSIYGGGISKRLRNNNGEITATHLGSSEDAITRSNGGLFLYGGSPGTTSTLYDTNHHVGQSNSNNNVEEPFGGWHQAGFSGSTMPPFPPQELVSDGQESNTTTIQASRGQAIMTPSRGVVSFDEEDEGLGNVVNVRYPYDWEQVSEVLFGGTPDFFQMP